MANPNADLGALAVARAAPAPAAPRHPRRWLSRVALPLALVAGFAALALWALWDVLFPPTEVKVIPVRVQTGTAEVVGQELFRANGWIEPRPRPTDVTVQTEGSYLVKQVLVNPGQRVGAGQPLIALDLSRTELDLEAAKNRYAKRLSAAKAAKADVEKAKVAITNAKAAVGLAKSEGEADVNAATAEVTRAEVAVKAADLAVNVEEELWNAKAVSSDVKLRQARQAQEVAKADRAAADAKLAKAKTGAEVRVKQAELALATKNAELASLLAKADEADKGAADAAVEARKVELELARAKVVAPIDGVVMALNVRPGTLVGGKGSLPESKGAVATLYDPARLQVRVEVPVAKFGLVRNGQPAEVEVEEVLPGKRLAGVVLYDTHFANISRNSVPVKVEISGDPPPGLRPEMIASVRFLAPASTNQPKDEAARRIVIPRRLLVTDSDPVRVWVVDPVAGRAELRAVDVAPGEKERQTELVELVGGLNPTDKLIATGRESLRPGSRVKVIGEER